MPGTAANPQRPVVGYFAYWIRRLQLADDLPAALAGRSVRAAIHEAPPGCRPSPVEAWLFDAATDHGDGIDCAHVVGWLRLRRALGDDAGALDPETARHWYERLGEPPRSSTPRWARRVRAVARDAETLGFGLSPRLVAALCAHPAWAARLPALRHLQGVAGGGRRPGAGRTATAAFALADSGRCAGADVARPPSTIMKSRGRRLLDRFQIAPPDALGGHARSWTRITALPRPSSLHR